MYHVGVLDKVDNESRLSCELKNVNKGGNIKFKSKKTMHTQ